MRATADAVAVRNAFNAVLAAMPEDRLRNLLLELLLAPFTSHPQHRKVGQPRNVVEEENIPLQRKTSRRRRRKGAVDEAKLAERRHRTAAARKAQRHAAKAAAGMAKTSSSRRR
jgi:hypothetical protein